MIAACPVVGRPRAGAPLRRRARARGGIRFTDDLRRLAASTQGGALADEAEARWRLVEAAWSLDLPRAGVAVQADAEAGRLFVERRVRRVDLVGVRPALSDYQRGR